MKVLTYVPPKRRKKEHLAIQENGKWVSLCGIYPYESAEPSKGAWVVRDEQPSDNICGTCYLRKRKLENPPEPRSPLPCMDPDAIVTLWTRENDERALVHTCAPGDTKKSRCGVQNPSYALDRWEKVFAQPASLVTCSLCLKAEGLYEGHSPYKQKKSGKGTWLDAWHVNQGAYHHSDPRGKKRQKKCRMKSGLL